MQLLRCDRSGDCGKPWVIQTPLFYGASFACPQNHCHVSQQKFYTLTYRLKNRTMIVDAKV